MHCCLCMYGSQSIKFEENCKHTLVTENPCFRSAIENMYMDKTKKQPNGLSKKYTL